MSLLSQNPAGENTPAHINDVNPFIRTAKILKKRFGIVALLGL